MTARSSRTLLMIAMVMAMIATACSGGDDTSVAGVSTDVTTRELRVPGTEVVPEEETNEIIEGGDDADDGADDDSADSAGSDDGTGPDTDTGVDTAALAEELLAAGVELTTDVEYNDANDLDVYAPAATGRWPIVVLFPGRGSDKSVYARLAGELASSGTVVFVPNWRGNDQPPAPVVDSRCAVDTAVAIADDYDGDASALTIVGAVFGAVPAAGVALSGPWMDYEIDRACPVPAAASEVDAFVGLIGEFESFDGLGVDDEAYQSFSPFSQIGDGPGPRVRIVHGAADLLGDEAPASSRFFEAADSAGYDAELVALDHPNLSLFGVSFDDEARSVQMLSADADLSGVKAAAAEIIAAVQDEPST